MAVREVLVYPDARLRSKAQPVRVVDDDIRKLIDDMIETMYASSGIGLAANQVGVLKRVVVLDVSYPDGESNLVALVNPEIREQDGEITWEEGCLSFPGIKEEVTRSERVKVKALNRDGESVEIDANDLFSVALQHEIDHLDGVLFPDRLSFLKRRMINRQMKKRNTG